MRGEAEERNWREADSKLGNIPQHRQLEMEQPDLLEGTLGRDQKPGHTQGWAQTSERRRNGLSFFELISHLLLTGFIF